MAARVRDSGWIPDPFRGSHQPGSTRLRGREGGVEIYGQESGLATECIEDRIHFCPMDTWVEIQEMRGMSGRRDKEVLSSV